MDALIDAAIDLLGGTSKSIEPDDNALTDEKAYRGILFKPANKEIVA